jgi:hypothetical protein
LGSPLIDLPLIASFILLYGAGVLRGFEVIDPCGRGIAMLQSNDPAGFPWGSALIEAHHRKEDQQPKREEAELLVGLTAIVATYWSKKCDRSMATPRARTIVQKG